MGHVKWDNSWPRVMNKNYVMGNIYGRHISMMVRIRLMGNMPRLRLWDLTKQQGGAEGRSVVGVGDETKAIYQEPNLRYRADDEQRTLMSGQILLRGLFGPELLAGTGDNDDDDETAVIKLHTADYTVDVLTPNGVQIHCVVIQ